MENLDPELLLTTTRSVRRRLDLDRPLDPEVVLRCLRIALQAPSGGNAQIWRWVLVTDAGQRQALGDIYRRTNIAYVHRLEAAAGVDRRLQREAASARALTENLGRVPVILAACFERPEWMDRDAYGNASAFGSVFPAVWNFQLACRLEGLATCTLTSQLQEVDSVAHALRLPEHFEQACLIAVAYPDRPSFQPASRVGFDDVVRIDRWSPVD